MTQFCSCVGGEWMCSSNTLNPCQANDVTLVEGTACTQTCELYCTRCDCVSGHYQCQGFPECFDAGTH
jgi:hypothetical protein